MIELLLNFSKTITAVEVISAFVVATLAFSFQAYRKIRHIYHQLTPNGGSSLADTINDIRTHQLIGQTRTQILWEHAEKIGYYECDGPAGKDPGACTWANKFLCDLFGLPLNEFIGFGWTQAIVSQSERNRIHKSWISAVADEIPYEEAYEIVNQRDGKHYQVKARAWACKNKKGEVLKMFGTLEVQHDGKDLH